MKDYKMHNVTYIIFILNFSLVVCSSLCCSINNKVALDAIDLYCNHTWSANFDFWCTSLQTQRGWICTCTLVAYVSALFKIILIGAALVPTAAISEQTKLKFRHNWICNTHTIFFFNSRGLFLFQLQVFCSNYRCFCYNSF